ncbi:stage V sporulation protein D [Clostridium sp. P21]|uniref:Stage V sporulation protein D n=1 Tax=Clostridium muellerianum TaxID=2716538 RepID=A0A7Y0EF31_9CLOT|nr:stage V sporulation protein D [Clostridium muellerianum]NMM62344.1 stage V sporulation protein D [Clostridium muellerianum]
MIAKKPSYKKEVTILVQKKKNNSSKKLFFILVMLIFIFLGIVGRLFYIMRVKSPNYKSLALKQWTNDFEIPARRGRILDRNGMEIAVSMNAYRVDLDMVTLKDSLLNKKMTMDQLAAKLSPILNMPTDKISAVFNRTTPTGTPIKFAILSRGIDKPQVDKINELKIKGLIISSDSKRYYPNNNFLASVLGYVNLEGKGVSGVELNYDKELSGIPGRTTFEADRNSTQLPYGNSDYKAPVNGKDIVLTIDENIQSIAEKAAQKALTDNKAKSVTITVMDPKTGEILAMVSKPDFDPNNPGKDSKGNAVKSIDDTVKNIAVQSAFEPGSIFKVITSYAAIKENVANENSTFYCNGSLKVDGHTINCWDLNGHGTETFGDIIKNSCNVGFMKLGQQLGKGRLGYYVSLFGFGQKTGIDLPGESIGIIKNPDKLNNVDLSSLAFGQGLSVTAVQYLSALNSVANGGTWIRPHIMKQITHADENNNPVVDKTFNNFGKKEILDANSVSTLKGYLEKVVSLPTGVGHNAFIDGYHIAGKTGTAQKANPKGGGYEADKYFSSFAGMAPVDDPKITLLVSVDEPDPSNYYAAQVSAPVAKDLFSEIFNYMIMKGQLSLNKTGN